MNAREIILLAAVLFLGVSAVQAYATINLELRPVSFEYETGDTVEIGLYAFINAQLESGQGKKSASNREALEYGREHFQRPFCTRVLDTEYWVVDVADYYDSADYGGLKEAMRGPRAALSSPPNQPGG